MNKNESKYFNTARLMDTALVELLNQKSIEYITVKEICTKAGVNRSTFYLHYDTIDDLVDETLENINKEFVSQFSVDSEKLIQNIHYSSLEDLEFINSRYLIPYLNFIQENKNIYNASFRNAKGMKSLEKMDSLKEYVLFPIMDEFGIPEKDQKYWVAFGIRGISAIIDEWLKGNCEDSVEYIVKIIIDCIRPEAHHYIENNQTDD